MRTGLARPTDRLRIQIHAAHLLSAHCQSLCTVYEMSQLHQLVSFRANMKINLLSVQLFNCV